MSGEWKLISELIQAVVYLGERLIPASAARLPINDMQIMLGAPGLMDATSHGRSRRLVMGEEHFGQEAS